MSGAIRHWRQKTALYLDLIRWDRPVGWLLVLWPTLIALWLAAEGWPGWHLLTVFFVGTVLMRSAGCCVNDVADQDFDRHVKRTAQRPITSGRVSTREALAVGAVLALLAFALVLTTTWHTAVWSFAALAVAIAYPYAKRKISMPQAVLGVAFSMGIPMAFVALQDHVPWQAWALMLGNLCWVLAYDTEYAMVDRDDDLKIGMKTSAITLGRWDVTVVMVCYLVFMTLWTWVLWPFIGGLWVGVAWVLSAPQIFWHHRLIRHRTREGCFLAFRRNHWLGASWFLAVLLSSVLGPL